LVEVPPLRVAWHKSRASQQGSCVEVAVAHDGHVLVRDTKDRQGTLLRFTPAEWTAFLIGVRSGEFDPV
jgi:hypothetical protein